jgi:RNA polymerase-binding transcription factor DksA
MATQKKKATTVAKKPLVKKPIAKKPDSHSKKSAVAKSISKKTATKKSVSAKKVAPKKKLPAKTAKPIVKSAPAKKSAKPGAKKAAPKKLSTNTKKQAIKKPLALAKKAASKKAPVVAKKSEQSKTKASEQKPTGKTIVKNNATLADTDHKKELKKALTDSVKKNLVTKSQKAFVMPKTNTEKSRKYEPQFVKSVLDHAPEENNGPTMRYSDNELNEFKDLISRKLETAKKELGYLQGLITRKDEMGGDDTDNRYMTMEDGSLSMEREQLSQMASRQITFIDHLEKAMMRIENKTYGICRVTGKLIDKARLRAVPHATLSIEAKMGIAK